MATPQSFSEDFTGGGQHAWTGTGFTIVNDATHGWVLRFASGGGEAYCDLGYTSVLDAHIDATVDILGESSYTGQFGFLVQADDDNGAGAGQDLGVQKRFEWFDGDLYDAAASACGAVADEWAEAWTGFGSASGFGGLRHPINNPACGGGGAVYPSIQAVKIKLWATGNTNPVLFDNVAVDVADGIPDAPEGQGTIQVVVESSNPRTDIVVESTDPKTEMVV